MHTLWTLEMIFSPRQHETQRVFSYNWTLRSPQVIEDTNMKLLCRKWKSVPRLTCLLPFCKQAIPNCHCWDFWLVGCWLGTITLVLICTVDAIYSPIDTYKISRFWWAYTVRDRLNYWLGGFIWFLSCWSNTDASRPIYSSNFFLFFKSFQQKYRP